MAATQRKIWWNKELSGTEGLCGRSQHVPERRKCNKSRYNLVYARSMDILESELGDEPSRIMNPVVSNPLVAPPK